MNDAPRLVRWCLILNGVGLAVQGALTLFFLIWSDSAADATHGVLNHDARHGLLHVIWGVALLLVLRYEKRSERQILVVLVFGVAYGALGVLGVVIHNPFGLMLGPGENAFHFIVASASLFVVVMARRLLFDHVNPVIAASSPRG